MDLYWVISPILLYRRSIAMSPYDEMEEDNSEEEEGYLEGLVI